MKSKNIFISQKTHNIIRLLENFLNSKLDQDVIKGYCLGFVLAASIYAGITPDEAMYLNNYLKVKSDLMKEVKDN